MSHRIDMSSPDVDKQIELLKFYPEIMEKHFRPVLVTDVSKLYSKIRGDIPKRTGRAVSKFKRSVSGKGVNLTGRVGWWGANQPWYINVVEHGAKAHREPNNRRFKNKPHPGFARRGFMKDGLEYFQPVINADLANASQAVVNEMAVK